jgi:putative hydrolase of the HAD superfamily
LPDVRAVFFDIYGTLLISGSGDVGTATSCPAPAALRAALIELGIETDRLTDEAGPEPAIRRHHAAARAEGADYPEVDILAVWQQTLTELVARGQLPREALQVDLPRLAVEYECRVNPVWPMPGLASCLEALRNQRVLGIVSNAQFFTAWLFPALLGETLEVLGFPAQMQYFSYRYGIAKPSPRLFEESLRALSSTGIRPDQTVYVGNDMLNDVTAAASVGLRTVLFAGDRRSLRWRQDDPRVAAGSPDLIITALQQLPDCVH